jgi:putative glutamine amidotransferase
VRAPDGLPTIAVTTGFTDYGDYLGFALSRPLIAAGAVPLLLAHLEDEASRAAALDRVDGLLLGFGRDIDPRRFGADPHPTSTAFSPHRDEVELALCAQALARGLPILGICRGMQLINVALGGTLYGDRSEYPDGGAEHPGGDWATWELVCAATLGGGEMPVHPSHPISIAADSRLAGALGERAMVNSYHHQAVRELGDGLVAVAWAPDGVIEAIELPGARAPVLGVQWELQQAWQDDPRSLAVFADFVAAAADADRAWTGGQAT